MKAQAIKAEPKIMSKLRLSPQGLILPPIRETKSMKVYLRKINDKPAQFRKHIIVGRDDIKKILDDTKAEIDFPLVDRNCNPRTAHASLGQHLQCKCAVPYASVVAAVVAGNGDDGHP